MGSITQLGIQLVIWAAIPAALLIFAKAEN